MFRALADGHLQVFAAGDDFGVNLEGGGQPDPVGVIDLDGHDVAVDRPILVAAPLILVPVIPFVVVGIIPGDAGDDSLLACAIQAVAPGPGGLILLPIPVRTAPFAVPEDLHGLHTLRHGQGDVHFHIWIDCFYIFVSVIDNRKLYIVILTGQHDEALAGLDDGIIPIPGPGNHFVFVADVVITPRLLHLIEAVMPACVLIFIFVQPEVIGPDFTIIVGAIVDFQAIIHALRIVIFGYFIPIPGQHRQLHPDRLILVNPGLNFFLIIAGTVHTQFEIGQGTLIAADIDCHGFVGAGPGPGILCLFIGAHAQIIGALLLIIGGVIEEQAVAFRFFFISGILPDIPVFVDADGIRAGFIGLDGIVMARIGRIIIILACLRGIRVEDVEVSGSIAVVGFDD